MVFLSSQVDRFLDPLSPALHREGGRELIVAVASAPNREAIRHSLLF
jgi:hypothetical protein